MENELKGLLQKLVGQLVWSVKRGHGTVISMEFGVPHLVVREPIKSRSDMPRVTRHLARRHVMIHGDFSCSLRTRDGRSPQGTRPLAWIPAKLRCARCCRSGQKVSAVRFDPFETILEFDLGATVRLGKSIFPTEPKSDLWSLTKFGTPGLSLLNDGSIVGGDEVSS